MAYQLPPICLLAGGLGTRLGATVRDTPKPLLNVAGEPFLIHQLRLLAHHGAARVVLCVGYLGELIEQRIGPSQFGVDIRYSYDGPRPIGTLGAVRKAASELGDRFLILYGDTYLRLDYRAAVSEWEASGFPALMTVLRNEGQWDVSNVSFDGTQVLRYDKRGPIPEMSWIDFGLGGLRSVTLDLLPDTADDLADLYHELAARGELFGFEATERFFEIGTPASLAETGEFLAGLRWPDGTRQ
jgi:NDP-sugar pyrophosphorylase family protein